MSDASSPPTETPPSWVLELMNPKEPPAWAQGIVTSVNTSISTLEQSISQVIIPKMKNEMVALIKPLSQDIANVNESRLADKTELNKKIEKFAEKAENDLEAMRNENKELNEKVKVLEKSIQNKTQQSTSWADIAAIPSFPFEVRTKEAAPCDDGEVPNPEEVKRVIDEAKKVLCLQPINDEEIEAKMKELNITKDRATIEEAYNFLEKGLGIKNAREELKIRSFYRPHDTNAKQNRDRLNVVFESVEDTKIIFQHVKKITEPDVKVMCWIPDSFNRRFRKMNDVAHSLRHGSVQCKTSIRWGDYDLILQQRRPNSRSWETVHIPNLPLVQLNPPPQASLPSSSPAPGLKKKRKRSNQTTTSPTHPEPKTTKKHAEANIADIVVKSKMEHFEALFTPKQSLVKSRSISSSHLPQPSIQKDIRASFLSLKPAEN